MMLKLEDILNGTDIFSILFRDTIAKIGQLSIDYLISTPDAAALKGDLITKVLNPVTQFTDCKIRIKDFNKLSFNVVFIMKEATLRGIQRVVEKDSSVLGTPLRLDRDALQKYHNEIDLNNYEKVFQFVKSNRKLTSQTIIKMVETGLTKIKPYINYRIDLSMLEIFTNYYPSWRPYLTALLDKCFEKLATLEEANAKRLDEVTQFVEKGKYYLVPSPGTGLPRLADFRNRILFDLKGVTTDTMLTKEDIDKFILDKNNFVIFRAVVTRGNNVIYGTLDGESYKLVMEPGGSVTITENTEKIGVLTERKTEFFREKLKPMLSPEVKIEIKAKYESYESVYVFYKKKRNEIYDSAIGSKNSEFLKMVQELLELEPTDPSYKVYKKPVTDMINALDGTAVNEVLLVFLREYSKNAGIFTRLFNMLFSTVKESDLKHTIYEDKAKAVSAARAVTADPKAGGVKQAETPVQSAINILKSSGQMEHVKLILMSNNDVASKTRAILKLCTDIGNTNKAHIEKTERSKAEFLKELLNHINTGA